MKRVQDKGGQTFAQEKTEDVVAVMAGGLESYFYIVQIACYRFEPLKKQVEAFQIVLNGERIRKNFSVRVYDVAVVLVLGNINADVDHGATLRLCI